MRYSKILLLLVTLAPVLFSCNKELNVNADWKDVTVVYGLLDQTQDTTFIKITKAFLGPGDAMQFAKIPDSSNYPDKLEVRLDEYNGTTLVNSLPCDTVTIHNKQAGDSIFYYPDQLMYYTTAPLNENSLYKLFIKNKNTGKEVTAETELVGDFTIERPQVASFIPGYTFEVKWTPSKVGKRYQLVIRFWYQEAKKTDPANPVMKYIDWLVFNNILAADNQMTSFDYFFPGDAFYSVVGSKIKVDTSLAGRSAHHCDFIFTVAASALNTYMEVTEPSLSLVQERPAYSNINNGIGIFSARFIKSNNDMEISSPTKAELKVNQYTKDLGF
ncbi:MAG: DUF4249 family protein [Bacteroidales bacterium]|nr:DUF4249 family protein [Bacteroidales bacterium]HNW72233.1 DUF4249 family protein [Bacteroidales bacterium]HPS49294.1 DUF4249 family protein [Bacteroidales bacterium]